MRIDDSSRAYSLIRLLGALAYDPDQGVFLFETGHIGMGFICQPSPGTGAEMLGHLTTLLNHDYPAGLAIQFSLWTCPDIEPLIAQFWQMRAECDDPILREMVQDRIRFLREGTIERPCDVLPQVINQQMLMVTLKLKIETPARPTFAELEKVKVLGGILGQALTTSGLSHVDMTAERYLRVMQTILNWGPEADWRQEGTAVWDPEQLLPFQVLDGGNAIHAREDRKLLRLGDKYVRMMSAKRYPDVLNAGLAVRYIQHPLTPGQRGVTWPMLMTFNILYLSRDALQSNMETQLQITKSRSYETMARFNPRINQYRGALETMLDSLRAGDRPLRAYLGIALFGDSKQEVSDACTHVKSYYNNLGLRMTDDAFAQLPIFANLLPMGQDPTAEVSLSRYKRMTTRHVAPMLPIYGDWQGTGTPLLTLVSRSGQPMPVDTFDTDTNMNAVIAAASGSGKSFLTNELITNLRSRGDQVVVIDVGHSYRGIARLLGGSFVDFVEGADLCINPFTEMESYAGEEDSVCEWIMAMASVNEQLNDLQVQQLKRVVHTAWNEHGQDLNVNLVAKACCADAMEEIQRIGHQLYPFTNEGAYGRYVNGRNNIRFDSDFVVLELEELNGQKQLQRVVLLQLMYQVDRAFYRGKRDRRRALIIDEAWDLFSSSVAADFITKAYRRFRKYRAMAVTITQSINDLYLSEETTAIAENSAFFFLLKQNQETIERIIESKRLAMPPFGIELLKTLTTVPGKYSEILCKTPYGIGVGRLLVSEFCAQLYSSRAEDVMEIEREIEQGADIRTAINNILARKGGKKRAA